MEGKDISRTCKVVLLNPPTAAPSSEVLLNLAYLSSVLKSKNHDVIVIDATAPHNRLNKKDIVRKINEFKPDFIGITLTIVNICHTYKFLKEIKKLKIPIVAGGPHANCLPQEVLDNGADIVAIGEGEETIIELAEYFLKKRRLKDIHGICYKDKKGNIIQNEVRPLIQNLNSIPYPDYEPFPIEYYTGQNDPDSNPLFWSLFTSRGCPYNCIFCSSHNVFGRTYRVRSPENVFGEIEHLEENYGATMFAFQDDEAFIDKKRVIKFCDMVKKHPKNLKFSGRLRIDSLDEEMLCNMKSAGFTRLAFGIESFNNETLLKINKKYDIETISKGFKILEKANFTNIYFNILIGFPWETPEHLRMNLEELKKIPKSIKWFASNCTLIPYPNTELYNRYHKEYGFSNWWLDPKMNTSEPKRNIDDAFFMMFMFDQIPLWLEDHFWNFSYEMKKAIHDFCWQVASMSLMNFLSKKEHRFVIFFSKISHKIWKISPTVERILMFPFKCYAKYLNLHEKVKFVNQ